MSEEVVQPPNTIRLDLDQGIVFLHDPDAMTQRAWDATMGELNAVRTNGDNAQAEKWYRARVAAWELTDPDTGAKLTAPATDDMAGVTRATLKGILAGFVEAAARPFPPRRPEKA